MKLNYKEDPKEWRKSALLTVLGLALLISVVCWRRQVSANVWGTILGVLAGIAVCAVLQPHWFRGYYRLSLRWGFYSSQLVGRFVLAVFFIFVVTPLGWGLWLAGKDLLRLKRPRDAATYWQPSKDCGPLDRLF